MQYVFRFQNGTCRVRPGFTRETVGTKFPHNQILNAERGLYLPRGCVCP